MAEVQSSSVRPTIEDDGIAEEVAASPADFTVLSSDMDDNYGKYVFARN